MELTKEEIRNMKLEEARRIIEENGWTDRFLLHRGCRQLYNWIYRNSLFGEIYGEQPETTSRRFEYDITKVLHYLERWASEEGTTIKEQAGKYGYYRLWLVYCSENEIDVNTIKINGYEKQIGKKGKIHESRTLPYTGGHTQI